MLIKRVEYEELKQSELSGVYGSMKDFEKRINKFAALSEKETNLAIPFPDKAHKILIV
ncbi:DUF771 domain-containing protein [Peribacillus sp. B-H-3]|uniref:DUF771 domain-containing protein n=1 Tax=Peribacillus sp. B-H-3 TaxID=3400420 RepID=UPI003B01262D